MTPLLRTVQTAGTLTVILIALVLCRSTEAGGDGPVERGDVHFAAGRFDEAREAFESACDAGPANGDAALKLARVELLFNRLDAAERAAKVARNAEVDAEEVPRILAEVHYRRDEFAAAAPLFRSMGRESKADQLASFGTSKPNTVIGDARSTSVKFIMTDPLPIIKARVNDSDEVNFLIDTGGGELTLDPKLAKKIGAKTFGSVEGVFAGGKKARSEHARVDSVQLGEFRIENVPVSLLNTSRFAAATDGMRVDGVLGTILLYHFLPTLDYPNDQLVLRRRGSGSALARGAAQGRVEMPFWLAGDHLMLAKGQVGDSDPMIMFVDTGLAGGGFLCPKSTIEQAKIDLPSKSYEGIGGGGKVRVTPFVMPELSLGAARAKNVPSFFGAFPPSLEHKFGFRIGGLVSHGFLRKYAVTFDFDRMRLTLIAK